MPLKAALSHDDEVLGDVRVHQISSLECKHISIQSRCLVIVGKERSSYTIGSAHP